MMHWFDAVPFNSAEEKLENRTELDFFLHVIDAASSYIDRRFNVECVSVLVLKQISSRMARGENFDTVAVRQLCKVGRGSVLQKATCCSTMRHTDPLIVR